MLNDMPMLDLVDIEWRNDSLGADLHSDCLPGESFPGEKTTATSRMLKTNKFASHQYDYHRFTITFLLNATVCFLGFVFFRPGARINIRINKNRDYYASSSPVSKVSH